LPDSKDKEFKLALPAKIGRGQEAKLKLVHPLVSRMHCEIYEQGDQLMVRDMASLNGTFVDDERVVDEMVLPSGCRLTVGSANFKVLYGADYDRPLPAERTAKSDAPTKLADETVPISVGRESASQEDTRTLDLDLTHDEPPKTRSATAPKAAATAKPPSKPTGPVKSAPATKSAASKTAEGKTVAAAPAAKPSAATPKAPARPPNPAEFADEDERGNATKPSGKKSPLPAKAASAPAASGKDGDKRAAGTAEKPGGESDDPDLDEFLKSIM
jgi:predicted component of type VI protein secretion system